MDLSLALATGIDIPIPECLLVVHQPTIKEIGAVGEKEFFTAIQCLCISNQMDRTDLEGVSNFQIFMTIMSDKDSSDKKNMVINTLYLLFPKYHISITPRALLFNLENENIIIDENNFSSFQEVLRQISCLRSSKGDAFKPADDVAAEIARKLERGRQRVAAQKQGADNNASVFSQYLSILTVGLHISLLELIKLTIFQLYDLIERYTLFVNYDLDIRSRLAGGQPDNQPENWMKIIH